MGTRADDPFAGTWGAFADAGLLDEAMIDQAEGDPLSVMVDLRTPDELDFDSRITLNRSTIEYRHVDMPDLDVDSTLTIKGNRYRVRNPPRGTGDGVRAIADLELVS